MAVARRANSKPRRRSLPPVASVIQAAIALRNGLPVAIRDRQAMVLTAAVEALDSAGLAPFGGGVLLLTHPRARTLKIRLYTSDIVALPLDADVTPERLRAVADPTSDLSEPLKGPFSVLREGLPAAYAASVKLAKLSGLLPATVAKRIRKRDADIIEVAAGDIGGFEDRSVDTLQLVTRANAPLEGAERTEIVAFRARDGGPEHYAILINSPPPHEPLLTRLHSECFTGDLLGSLKCDCGSQLRGAIKAIADAGGGAVLYLAQEGRGIGLVNKLRAYRLQDQGFDTLSANERLGFEPDERRFAIAARMLALLGYKSVRLLTNNPAKVRALKSAGIVVAERVPLRFAAGAHNQAYLDTKAKAGHLL